jgi:hypothetical protein
LCLRGAAGRKVRDFIGFLKVRNVVVIVVVVIFDFFNLEKKERDRVVTR